MKKSTFKRVLFAIKPYMGYLILSILCAALYAAISLIIPVLIGKGIDLIVEKNVYFGSIIIFPLSFNNISQHGLLSIFAYIICLIIIGAPLQYLLSLANNKITYYLTRDLRKQTFDKIQRLPLSYLDSHPTGDILSRMSQDIETLSDGLLLGFSQVFTGVVSIVITLVYMCLLNYLMAIVVIFLTPISLFVAKYVAKKIHKYFKDQARIKGEQSSFIEEMISGQKVVRAFNKEDDLQNEFESLNNRLEKVALKANFFSSLVNPATRVVNASVYALIALIGAILCVYSKDLEPYKLSLSVGMLSTFLYFASQYTKPFNDISQVITELQNAFTCADRVFSLLDEVEEIKDREDAEELRNVQGNINIENVSFSYDKNKKLLQNLNLKVDKAMKIALVGPTGCGKTTFINLLMRFYDVDEGAITIDNKDIREVKRASLRENYGMILQDTWLRYGTIRDNILMGKEASEEELINACKRAHAHHFISLLENGYDTIIDENGGRLSAGQKQLLCIARIMVNIPPMLILDEATSSIDTRTEMKIQDAFDTLMKGRTTFVVAHRLSTIVSADIILVMNEGQVIEMGNHQELLAKKGFYYNLYNAQFAK